MYYKLKEMDQDIIQRLMCIFLLRYDLKLKEIDQGILQGLMCIFFLRYVLKAQGNRPSDPSGLMCMCVYSCQICIHSSLDMC